MIQGGYSVVGMFLYYRERWIRKVAVQGSVLHGVYKQLRRFVPRGGGGWFIENLGY